MATMKARGQITIIDQNDAVSFQAFIGSNLATTQIYNKDTNSYTPNWAASPWLVLTPQLFISGASGDSITAPGRIKPGSAGWKKNGVAITNGGNYVINSSAPFTLTIKSNENVGGGVVKYDFSAVMIDPSNGLEVNFSTTISFNTMMNSSAGIVAVCTAPDGTVFKNDQVPALRLTCELYRGNQVDNTLVGYKWGMQDSGVFAPTTLATAAAVGNSTIKLASVNNVLPGSSIRIGSATYKATAINVGNATVTITPNISTAAAVGAAVISPFFDAEFGTGWAKIDADPYFSGITGHTTGTITIPSAAVLNFAAFKCIIKDNDSSSGTFNQSAFDIISLVDFSDPISIDIAAPQGSIIKNGVGNITLTAKVWQAGQEIDLSGSLYGYSWARFDSNGVVDGTFAPTTKTITVTPANVAGKATFEVRLMTLI